MSSHRPIIWAVRQAPKVGALTDSASRHPSRSFTGGRQLRRSARSTSDQQDDQDDQQNRAKATPDIGAAEVKAPSAEQQQQDDDDDDKVHETLTPLQMELTIDGWAVNL
jgi:hypothetical protein